MLEFKGKTALIIGAGSGIGEALAYQFAKRGTDVIITGLKIEIISKVKERCEAMGVKGHAFVINNEDRTTLDGLVSYIEAQNLMPDFIIFNSGISQRALSLESNFSIDTKLMDINYFGAVYITKKLGKLLSSDRKTHIAVTTSISGLFGFPLRSAYCASKRALFGFFESLELEYPNINVTFLIPGRINTQISKSAVTASGEPYAKMDPGQAKGMDVEKCAKIAIKAIARKRHKKLIGRQELLMAYIYKYLPSLYYKLARKVSAT